MTGKLSRTVNSLLAEALSHSERLAARAMTAGQWLQAVTPLLRKALISAAVEADPDVSPAVRKLLDAKVALETGILEDLATESGYGLASDFYPRLNALFAGAQEMFDAVKYEAAATTRT
jgi:hypothetical protein